MPFLRRFHDPQDRSKTVFLFWGGTVLCHIDWLNVNRTAIGAQVRVHVNGWVLTRQVEGGTGEGNQNDLVLHFGFGQYDQDVPVEVTWPNGQVQTVSSAVHATVTVEMQE